jgi:hypothetical protein
VKHNIAGEFQYLPDCKTTLIYDYCPEKIHLLMKNLFFQNQVEQYNMSSAEEKFYYQIHIILQDAE